MRSFPDAPFDSQQSAIVEQRLFLRKKVALPLPIELFPGKEVWLDDLGEGGLSVSGSSRLELGATTFVAFQFPGANAVIEAIGVIAWCEPSGRAGVRFTRIKPDSTAALKRWLKAEAAERSEPETKSVGGAVELEHLLPGASPDVADLIKEITSENLRQQAALDLIAERMLHLTRASGAAIAWREAGNVICQASAGNAPEIGAKLDVVSSLTGECYRTGNIVSLSDSENDTRVDSELRRALDFRSLLIIPVRLQEQVIGIVEVFSPLPGNFEGGDILLLGSIAELIAQLYAETPNA